MRKILIVAAAALAALLGACSKTSCAGLSDKDLVARIAKDYASQPASSRGDAAQKQFAERRVRGIGRGQGQAQVWFAQDDGTLTVASLSDGCQAQYRPGLAADSIRQAAIPTRPPKF